MSSSLVGVRVDHTKHWCKYGPPSGQKNEPKYAQNNHNCLCPCSNSIIRGHLSLKYPKECLYHVRLPFWCPDGPYHTLVTIRQPSGPKNKDKYAQTKHICLCPCSNSIVRGPPSLESLKERLYYVRPPCWCPGGPHHTFVTIGPLLRPKK